MSLRAAASETVRRDYIRAKVLHDHIERAVRRDPKNEIALAEGLTYATAISLVDEEAPDSPDPNPGNSSIDESARACLPGSLTKNDMMSMGPPPPNMDQQFRSLLSAELKQTLLSILDFWSDENDTDENRLETAIRLHEDIEHQKNRISKQENELQDYQKRIQHLVAEINEIHPRLEDELTNALLTLPPILNASRTAQYELLATTIETSLLKLSLIRARAHSALYGHTSPKNPDATMSRALAAARDKIREKERAQEREEKVLDEQIDQYQKMLDLVGGRDGSFGQVVKDMARVKRETEECRRDLRRLGWTGD
ncbi:hypothetical protein A0H81_06027 [Grifola frondosa]|uniref:Uncharacterized protein n=1 Tax=Grifola frondosa TaxID=5627 RepID=A0A1C7MAX9_GRIFR|nr:hypothetical protein A0H81_06027 [Grifola frondosa]